MTQVTCHTEITFDISDIDDEDLEKEYRRREKLTYFWVPVVYRMMAEGRVDDAMQEMQRYMPELAPPSHERAIADLLTGKRN